MSGTAARRYYFDAYALTYNADGWALLHKDDGLVGTDLFPSALKVPFRDDQTLLQFVEEAMRQGLGDPL